MIGEKAKAYDDAVEYAKRVLDGLSEDYLCTHMTKDDIRNQYSRLFPNEAAFQDDEDSFANRKLIYGLKSLLQQGKETFAGADIEDLIYYLERKKPENVVSVKANNEPIPTENNAVNISPKFTEGELKVIKDIMGYLDYKGMEDYHDSLENIMLKYGGDKK